MNTIKAKASLRFPLLRWTTAVCVVCLALVLITSGGCRGKKEVPISPDLTAEDTIGPTGPEETTTGEALPDVELEKLLWDPNTGLRKVYFDFDRYALRPDALATLSENADKIKRVPGVIIQIEGHCDERGTQEYNLALGERRALAAREHLMKLGISGDRLITISYGEEDPAMPGHDESAWKWNRRCEFNKAM